MKAQRSRVALVATLLAVCGLLAACGSGGDGGGTSAGGAKQWKLAMVIPSPDPFWLSIEAGAKQQAAKMGVELTTYAGPSGATDAQGAIDKVNDALVRQPDGLVLVPNFQEEYVPVIRKALAQGVKVALANSGEPTLSDPGLITTAATDEAKGGALAGQYFSQQLPKGSQIGVLHCYAGNPQMDTRVDNMEASLAAASGVRVVTTIDARCDAQKGRTALQNMLTAHPDLAGLFSNSDNNILGSLDLIKQHRLTVVSYDAQEIVARAIKAGVVAADVVQFPKQMGVLAVKGLVDGLNGKAVAKTQDSGAQLATEQNVDQVTNN